MGKEIKDNDVFPEIEPTEDKVYRLAEGAASFLPTAQTILQSIIAPPIQKRLNIWVNKVEERLLKLEAANKINFNELEERPEFSALLLRTIRTAAITSQEEQLEILQDFVVNLSLKPNISEDELYIILDIIGSFTPSHIKVLKFYHSPLDYLPQIVKFRNQHKINEAGKVQGQELAKIFEVGSIDYWQNIFYMVSGKHIITNHTTMIEKNSPDLVVNGRTTELGNRVVDMIEKK